MSWKAQARRLINRVLEPAGFTLRRFQPEMRVREMISPQVRARQITAFRAAMAQSLAAFPELAQRLPPEADIRSFTEALPHCPVMQDTGGGGGFRRRAALDPCPRDRSLAHRGERHLPRLYHLGAASGRPKSAAVRLRHLICRTPARGARRDLSRA